MPYWKLDLTRVRRTYKDYRELFKTSSSKDDLKDILESNLLPLSVYFIGSNTVWKTHKYEPQLFRWSRRGHCFYLDRSYHSTAAERCPEGEGRARASGTEGEALGWGAND